MTPPQLEIPGLRIEPQHVGRIPRDARCALCGEPFPTDIVNAVWKLYAGDEPLATACLNCRMRCEVHT